jgi:hypothetical protein
MAERLRTATQVIDALGGNRPVADLLGVTPAAVSNWRHFGVFPAYTYVVLSEIIRSQDYVVSDRLWAVRVGSGRRRTA